MGVASARGHQNGNLVDYRGNQTLALVVAMTLHTSSQFRDLLAAACQDKGLTQHQLAFHAEVSQTAISLVGSHKRKLSVNLAGQLARILGGTPEFWLNAAQAYRNGTPHPIDVYLSEIRGGLANGQTYGVGRRALLNMDILELFWKERDQTECRIKGFDPRRISYSSYYTRLGFVEGLDGDPTIPRRTPFDLDPNEGFFVRTLEQFHFPLWLEAELQAASAISDAGLSVDNGPTIDPGFDGHLRVSIKNLSPQRVTFEPNWNFLKLRFFVFEKAAKPMSDIKKLISSSLTDDDVYADAVSGEF